MDVIQITPMFYTVKSTTGFNLIPFTKSVIEFRKSVRNSKKLFLQENTERWPFVLHSSNAVEAVTRRFNCVIFSQWCSFIGYPYRH